MSMTIVVSITITTMNTIKMIIMIMNRYTQGDAKRYSERQTNSAGSESVAGVKPGANEAMETRHGR